MNAPAQTPVDFERLVATINDAIIISDPAGTITFWNPGAERIFGFAPIEALGHSLELIIPARLRERHWAGYEKTMATGKTRYAHDVLRVPAIHKDGHTLSIAFTVALLCTQGHEINGIVAVIRDETTRFLEDRRLRERLRELEAKCGTKTDSNGVAR